MGTWSPDSEPQTLPKTWPPESDFLSPKPPIQSFRDLSQTPMGLAWASEEDVIINRRPMPLLPTNLQSMQPSPSLPLKCSDMTIRNHLPRWGY